MIASRRWPSATPLTGPDPGAVRAARDHRVGHGGDCREVGRTGKVNELRTFFTAGTSSNPNSLPIGSPNGVTAFLAKCNSIRLGSLGNTTTPRGQYWQVSHPYYANYSSAPTTT